MLEDEIEQLREQLRETVDENGRLYKLLKERDFEIQHLKKKIEEDRFAFTGSSTIVATVPALKSRWAAWMPWTYPSGQIAGSRGQVPKRECQRSAVVKLVLEMRQKRGREQAKEASMPGHGSTGTAGTARQAFRAQLVTQGSHDEGSLCCSLPVRWASRVHFMWVLWLRCCITDVKKPQ